MPQFLKQIEGAVNRAPSPDVIPVKAILLDGQDFLCVVEILEAFAPS